MRALEINSKSVQIFLLYFSTCVSLSIGIPSQIMNQFLPV